MTDSLSQYAILHWRTPRKAEISKLERRLKQIGCRLVRTSGGHRHYSNPFHPERLITFAWHPGDVPRGIIADIVEDLGISRENCYFKKF